MALPAYLLIGCILMLIAIWLVDGCITRREFVRGMIIWPLVFVYGLEFFLSAVVERWRRWLNLPS
jgi:cell division protein FtsW (lipid II flippase)